MSGSDYDAFADPYCYTGSFVLKNRAGLRDAAALEAFELEMTSLRAEEPLPAGRFGPAHYRAVHRHLFQDVYRWAGRYRTVRTSKDGNPFCFPEHIPDQMNGLFAGLRERGGRNPRGAEDFIAVAADFLAELNANSGDTILIPRGRRAPAATRPSETPPPHNPSPRAAHAAR